MSPRTLFRTFALAEFITWALLISGLIARSLGVDPVVTTITGGIHGFVFLCYGVVTVFVWINERWPLWIGLTGLLTTLIPFATLPFELVMDHRGRLSRAWRLRRDGDAPRNVVEHIAAWVLRAPWLAVGLGVIGVTTAFVVLLILGPPVPR